MLSNMSEREWDETSLLEQDISGNWRGFIKIRGCWPARDFNTQAI